MTTEPVVISGGGIAGLCLALQLHARGIPSRIYESAPELKPLGVGISLLPHGTRVLAELGLFDEVQRRAVVFQDSRFFTNRGQEIYRDTPATDNNQFLIHRADLHEVLVDAVVDRLGRDAFTLGVTCVGAVSHEDRATASLVDTISGRSLGDVDGAVVLACDGIHSKIRAQHYPDENGPVFQGINMWRGVTVHPPILSSGTHARIGTINPAKLVVYPIRNDVDGHGNQLLNWVAEVRSVDGGPVDWSKPGKLEDFLPHYADWTFDWLDVPAMMRNAELILEYPMADRNPLPRWTFDRVTLVGDAAHAMVPRGSNGAMQALLDTVVLAEALATAEDPRDALSAYEADRLPKANLVVTTNRSTPPDHLIEMFNERTSGRSVDSIYDVMTQAEIDEVLGAYKRIAGYDPSSVAKLGR